MDRYLRSTWRWVISVAAEVLVALLVATLVIYLLEAAFGVEDASNVYLLSVTALAIRSGPWSGVAVAIGAFLTYNYLFVEPRYTFTVAEPSELITLFLLLVVGVVTGRLAGLQRERARDASRREREATTLFGVSRLLATAPSVERALPSVLERVGREARLRRTWVAVGPSAERERVVADWGGSAPPAGAYSQLRRSPDDQGADWVRLRPPTRPARQAAGDEELYRVALVEDGEEVGSLWGARSRDLGEPGAEESRLMAAAADQVAAAIERDRLTREAAEAEIVRRSDALKSALLDSVSHDLRTPLAAIRAAAGSIGDPAVAWSDEETRQNAAAIDAEAERLDRLVGNLLDMSRIEGGALKPDLEVVPVDEMLKPIIERARTILRDRLEVDAPGDLPLVKADLVFIEQVLGNLLENAAKYTPEGVRVRLRARPGPDDTVRLSVEDAGPGVPDVALPRLFEKFFRVSHRGERSRRGTGLGMAVARGLTEAMGGSISASRSELGGLAVTVDVPIAPPQTDQAGRP